MVKDFVTIVIPVYNGAEKIKRTLDSLLKQTQKGYEIIIVDDGSEDTTKSVVMEYSKYNDKIKYFYKDNKGVSSARNYGIEKSSGKYIAFLDCEDYYCSNLIEEMYNKSVKEDCDICYCGFNNYDKEKIKRVRTKFPKRRTLQSYLNGKLKLQTGCFFIKKELIIKNNIKFRENSNWGEDFEFFCNVLKKAKKISRIKKYMVYYNNEYSENKLSNFSINKIEKNKVMISNILDDIELSQKEQRLLINYLNPALLLNYIYQNKERIDYSTLQELITKNQKVINDIKFVNGLRTIKICIIRNKLYKRIRNIKHKMI